MMIFSATAGQLAATKLLKALLKPLFFTLRAGFDARVSWLRFYYIDWLLLASVCGGIDVAALISSSMMHRARFAFTRSVDKPSSRSSPIVRSCKPGRRLHCWAFSMLMADGGHATS